MSDEKRPLVLIIDDEEIIRKSFHDYLEDCGYDVLEAENGRIGIETFEQEKPGAVLLDLRMPEMDGLEVLSIISERSAAIPVIVISGAGDITDAVEALRLGAWDYLLKPIESLSFLKHSIEKAMERSRLIRENIEYQELLEEKVKKRTEELQRALEQVKKISGLLPICASCKKIRDDKGYWNQIEIYIKEHSDAEFSHGICPECAKKIYPELYEDVW